MKRVIWGAVLLLLLLNGCSEPSRTKVCNHQWAQQDCLNAKTCLLCHETEGTPLGHDWAEADCLKPRTCRICQIAEGEPAGHRWQEADCAVPRTCSICGNTEGMPLPHSMGLWSIQGNQMIRSCANCLEPESIPYDGERLALDNHMGNWIHLVTERYVQYGIEYVLTGHSSYCVSLLEDGTFTACLGKDISGVWTRDADVDPKTKSACYTLHYSDGNIQKKLEVVIEADKAHITDKSTETMQMYYFCREGKWNYPEQKNLVTGCWNSLLLDVFETGMRAEHQVATDRSITFRADGTLEAYFDGEKTGRWVYTGSFIGLNEMDETLCYVIQFDGEEKGYGVSIKEESRLCISGRDNRTNYNRWFAQVSVEEAEFFAEAKEMVCGVWQATSALLENPETGILDLQTDPSGYHLTFREDGELDVSGTVPMQCTWEQDMYAFELDEGCRFMLYSNGMYYSCTLTQDGKLEVLLPTGEGLVLLVLEKE